MIGAPRLPSPDARYDARNEAEARRAIENALNEVRAALDTLKAENVDLRARVSALEP